MDGKKKYIEMFGSFTEPFNCNNKADACGLQDQKLGRILVECPNRRLNQALFCALSEFVFVLFRLDALAKALSVIATATWLGVRHTPVLYQNGYMYPKTFSTI